MPCMDWIEIDVLARIFNLSEQRGRTQGKQKARKLTLKSPVVSKL